MTGRGFRSQAVTVSGSIATNGADGNQGACTCGGAAGGGGAGRIVVKAPVITGTTNPTFFGG